MPPVVLASTSPYRKLLLEKIGLPFQSAQPKYIEQSRQLELPQERALRHAKGKASALTSDYASHLIIGSDQVAFLPSGRFLSKPGNFDNARAQLQECSGKTVHFYTGLCLINSATGTIHNEVEEYRVHFRELSNQQIERYLKLEEPYDCAGSFKSEGLGICLFSRLEGRDPNSLIGLPLILLIDLLAKEGISIPS